MNVKAKGYILGAVAAATYGMNPLFALPLYKANNGFGTVFPLSFCHTCVGDDDRGKGEKF